MYYIYEKLLEFLLLLLSVILTSLTEGKDWQNGEKLMNLTSSLPRHVLCILNELKIPGQTLQLTMSESEYLISQLYLSSLFPSLTELGLGMCRDEYFIGNKSRVQTRGHHGSVLMGPEN